MTHFLLRHRDIPDINQLDVFRKNGGFEAFQKAVKGMKPEEITEIVKASGLRGRGGAGFPTGLKWSFIDQKNWPHYVVANADESEPGTFKDREIMESNPFQFLEGVAICSYAVGAKDAYIYLRGEFWQVAAFLDEKIKELEKAGLLGDKLFGTEYCLRIHTHLGAGAYICGEETALLESMEGKRGQPRLRPPFPPSYGLYGKPTVVNNVETLTNVPLIISKGADWYKSLGTEDSTGVKLFSLSGRVNKPGNYELPFGTTFRKLIYEEGGGIIDDRPVKAIMPAGASSRIIRVDETILDTPMDYASCRAIGAELGSASVIVIDDTVSIEKVISKTVEFFKHESCGKCTPCRVGTVQISKMLDKIISGKGTQEDIKKLEELCNLVNTTSLCGLGISAPNPVISTLKYFREEYDSLLQPTQTVEEGVL